MNSFVLKRNIPLKTLTTFGVGGYARYLVETKNKKDIEGVVNFAKEKKLPIFVIGGGSDILVSDKGFSGVVVKYAGDKVVYKKEGNTGVLVTAESGKVWDELVADSVKENLQGIECLSGIPGKVGAAPIQNIGAYGQEIKDVFVNLTAYDSKKMKFVTLDKKTCRFSYRDSIFKRLSNKGRYIIVDITLRLTKNKKPTLTYNSLLSFFKENNLKSPSLLQVRNAVLTIRGQKLDDPKIIGNAGSFFKNPIIEEKFLHSLQIEFPDIPFYPYEKNSVKVYAGWLIEKVGWKGKKFKQVAVSSKNALVITNPRGQARAAEVKQLAEKISSDVYKKFKINLEPEVQYIGF